MMEDLKHKWEQIDEDDYVAKYRDMMLRVEKMEKQKWWWAVYKDNEDLCYDNAFTRNSDYGKKLAEQCVRDDESENEIPK